jgi:DNA polymerase III subunit chi
MKQVEFHHGMADKLAYACRLLRKAYRSGSRVVVTGDVPSLHLLDKQLWVFEQQEFVPHVCAPAGQALPAHLHGTPIWLTDAPASAPGPRDVLVNIGQQMPQGIEAFERFFEVVSTEPQDRQLGRQRWRQYETQGWTVKAHAAQD